MFCRIVSIVMTSSLGMHQLAAHEIKQEAKVPRKVALSIGIPIDHRRQNTSVESLQQNVARLNEYKSSHPRRSRGPPRFAAQLSTSSPSLKPRAGQGGIERAQRKGSNMGADSFAAVVRTALGRGDKPWGRPKRKKEKPTETPPSQSGSNGRKG